MSCLNLRLPPAKKAWKSFTSKLLHKLHTSRRSIKKSGKRYRFSGSTTTSAKAIIFERGDRRTRQFGHPYHKFALKRHSSRFRVKKKSATVYIDKLFPDPVTELVAGYPPTSSKNVKLVVPDREEADAEKEAEIRSAGDTMWESLGFASPQMQGIDERAEQFISRFRAEMELQDKIARGK